MLVRHIADDNVVQSPPSTGLLEQIDDGQVRGLISMTVLFETAYVLERIYRLDRIAIAESLLAVMAIPGISMLPGERAHLEPTIALYMSIPQLSFADCYHARLGLAHCKGEIYTFDRDFDRVPGITRLEPGD